MKAAEMKERPTFTLTKHFFAAHQPDGSHRFYGS